MSKYTIETTYHLPIYRQRTYEAATFEEACRLAREDGDWSDDEQDYESAGETYVTGIWECPDAAYRGDAIPVPSQFGETERRKAEHFDDMLNALSDVLAAHDHPGRDTPRGTVRNAIAKARAIIARQHDPDASERTA
jgi:hypothetical protein